MQKQVLLILVLLFSQALAGFDNSVCTVSDDGTSTETYFYGVSTVLAAGVSLIPAAGEFLAPAWSLLNTVWGLADNGGSGQTDYTNQLSSCLKSWVVAKLDKDTWKSATDAFGNIGGQVKLIATYLNDSTELPLPPKENMRNARDTYDQIKTLRHDIEQYFAGNTGSKTSATQLLQLNLDAVSIQSQVALTVLLYGQVNRDSLDDDDFLGDLVYYMDDVEQLIAEQFDYGDQYKNSSIPYIFDHSDTSTKWVNSFLLESGNCGDVVGWITTDCSSGKNAKSWCHIKNTFSGKTNFECVEDCNTNTCDEPCDWGPTCAPHLGAAYQNITNSLAAVRNHIKEANLLQKEILIRMQNIAGCDCNINGTETCNLKTKECGCRLNVTGDKCDQCKDEGTFPYCTYTDLRGPQDVGGTCPSSTYSHSDGCCCRDGTENAPDFWPDDARCCWNECVERKPDDCLDGVQDSEWYSAQDSDWYPLDTQARKWSSKNSAVYLTGESAAGGNCPSPAYSYPSAPGATGGLCCCKPFCCWDKCQLDNPPEDCLSAIPNSKWIWNEEKGYYQAAQFLN